jgi:hypothetical protein
MSLAAAAASSLADASGIDPLLLRVLCVRCAKVYTDAEKVEDGHQCK